MQAAADPPAEVRPAVRVVVREDRGSHFAAPGAP